MDPNFGINPNQLFVSKSVINYGCNECSSTLHIHDENQSFEGGSCLNYRCSGKYKSFERTNFNYYNLYTIDQTLLEFTPLNIQGFLKERFVKILK